MIKENGSNTELHHSQRKLLNLRYKQILRIFFLILNVLNAYFKMKFKYLQNKIYLKDEKQTENAFVIILVEC